MSKNQTAAVAAAIRRDVAAAFNLVFFSVEVRSYTGGAAIVVTWTEGPTEAQVREVTGKYQKGDTASEFQVKVLHTVRKMSASARVVILQHYKLDENAQGTPAKLREVFDQVPVGKSQPFRQAFEQWLGGDEEAWVDNFTHENKKWEQEFEDADEDHQIRTLLDLDNKDDDDWMEDWMEAESDW